MEDWQIPGNPRENSFLRKNPMVKQENVPRKKE